MRSATKKLAILVLAGACLMTLGCDKDWLYSDLSFGYDSFWDPYGDYYYSDSCYYDDYCYDDYYWEEEVYYDDCYSGCDDSWYWYW